MSAEVGGMNSIEPLLVGARLGLPVIDADGMGRAFPELQVLHGSGGSLGIYIIVQSGKKNCTSDKRTFDHVHS